MDKRTEGAEFTDARQRPRRPAQLPVSRGGTEEGGDGAAGGAEGGAPGEEEEEGAEGEDDEGAAGVGAAGAAAFLTWPSCHLPAKACRSESRLRRSCPLTVRL